MAKTKDYQYTRKYTSLTDMKGKWKDAKSSKRYKNKDEYHKVCELEFRLDEMKSARNSNCYWGVDGGLHQSWDAHWDWLQKAIMMWKKRPTEEEPEANLKSTFIYNAVETALTEMYDLNLMPAVIPWTRKGEQLAPAIENIIKYPILKHSLNEVWLDAMQEALWFGNSFIKIDFTKIVRKKKVKKLEDFTEDEVEELKEGKKTAIWIDSEIVEYNDVDWVHIPVQDYYPDPNARRQHGRNFAAVDGIWERRMSYDQFCAEFKNKRGFYNLDKVKMGVDSDTAHPLFAPPEYLENNDNVVVRVWENKQRDFVRYTANNVLIGEHPLPNHGELSVIQIGAIKVPHQYYYMGLADVLIGLQTEDEVMRNSFLELLEIALRPPIIANNIVAGEFKDQWDGARYQTGEIISISGSPNEVQWMQPAIDKLAAVFGMRAQIKDDVISVSLIDPKASAQPTNSPTAFEAMQMTTATMKSFAKLLKTASRGIGKGFKLTWELQKQEYPLHYSPEDLKKREGDRSDYQYTQEKSREIFTKGLQLKDEDGEIKVTKTPGKNGTFEIKDNYFDVNSEDCDIIVSPESQQPLSKIARAKKSEEALAQLMPLYMAMRQDPTILQDPRIMALHNDYVVSHDLDDDYLQGDSEDPEKQIDRAKKQNAEMWKNSKIAPSDPNFMDIKPVLGEFGEPMLHRIEHLKFYHAKNKKKQKLELDLEQVQMEMQELMPQPIVDGGIDMQTGVPTGGPTMDPMMPQNTERIAPLEKRSEELIEEIEQLDRFLTMMLEHYEVDRMVFEQAQELILAQEAGVAPGQEGAMPPPPPDMQGMPPMSPGGPGMMPPQMQPQVDIPMTSGQSPQEAMMMV